MKVAYNRNLNIGGIGVSPWPRLGLERWFDDYAIAALQDWDIGGEPGVPPVFTPPKSKALKEHDSHGLLNHSVAFQQLLLRHMQGRQLLAYKPLRTPAALRAGGIRLLGEPHAALAAALENKIRFRELFKDAGIPFPPYKVCPRHDERALYGLLDSRKTVVIQAERSSGGRGTYIVGCVGDLQHALNASAAHNLRRLLVSDFIERAHERSVHAVVTRYGVFVGPLQKQIVGEPHLVSRGPEANRFCGAEISNDDPCAAAYNEIRGYAQTIGEHIRAMGYKGVFGLDCLVSDTGSVYVLEINPRLTGVTPLLTMLYRETRDIPFMLLHVLELAGADYTITDDTIDPHPPEGSMLRVGQQQRRQARLVAFPPSGLYDMQTQTLVRKGQYHVDAPSSGQRMLLQSQQSRVVHPHHLLAYVFTNGHVLDSQDNLSPDIVDMVARLRQAIVLEDITDNA